MICLSSKLPVLQVGAYQLKDYDTSWILKSIEDALACVGLHSSLVSEIVYYGVLQYLENECPWVPLKIEDLYAKIEYLFGKIGFSHLSHAIPRYSPDIKISVAHQLSTLVTQTEHHLLEHLQYELDSLAAYGVQEIILDNIVDAVQSLIPDQDWGEKSQHLYNEIIALQETYNANASEI